MLVPTLQPPSPARDAEYTMLTPALAKRARAQFGSSSECLGDAHGTSEWPAELGELALREKVSTKSSFIASAAMPRRSSQHLKSPTNHAGRRRESRL
ncbi:MAG: hypothetical protein HYX43_08060 [Burkholderiales bacterium]|nr:hypothetical protein [Burkholderiales bacterium]